ncbi:MOSC domain-containing protein [Veillonella denticariosi JCM 15641]|uniref:MOSC domain-containing protein n=1 Tax=Veillonella denticariosi JCM 15641 TaxID=1298594 RepID=A0A2S7Z860_9FIRM|nr:MOSC domain-containing protein [Veillonella denticariosi]PQL19451.1 MOSC domain-containing protein [Veillonella denticariosi JCM 15641]
MAEGKIIAISISERKGQKKHNIESANLIVDHGMEGDAHAGNWHRQISLLGIASIEHMREQGADVHPGDFAENITVEGMVLYELAVGTRLKLGNEAILEVTQIGKECHQGCEIMKQVGSCIMPTQGIFGKVLKNGTIRVGDDVLIIK